MAKPEATPRELLRLEISERSDGDNFEPEPLKNKQYMEFAMAFVDLDNGKASGLKAGYSEKSAQSMGSKLLSDPTVRSWIAHLTVLRNCEVNLDKNWVIRRLMREADVMEGSGASQSARVQALNKLGTYVGMWDEDPGDADEIGVTITKRV